jgi:hypothetical protein
VADRQKAFGGEIAIGELVAEKHAHDCRNGKGIQD